MAYRQPKGHPPPMRTIVKPKPKPRTVAAPPLRSPAPSAVPTMSAQDWADAQAQRLVDEQVKAIQEQQATYNQTLQQQAAQQAADAQKFAQLVQALGIDKTINGIYSQAGHDITGYAQGFAGALRDTATADAAAQTRMVSGTGQEGAVRNEGEGMGNVLYGVGGNIPGQNLAAVGAAAATDAARQPGFMLEQRIGDAQKALNEGLASGGKDFLDAILKVKTSKQDISSDLYKQRVDLNLTQQKMRQQQLNDDRNYWLKMQAWYMSQKKFGLAKDAEKRARAAETRYANETMGRDADGNVAPGFIQLPDGTIMKRSDWNRQQSEKRYRNKDKGLDVNGNVLPGYVRKPNGTIVKRSSSTAGGKGLTPNAANDVLQGVLSQEDDMTKAMPSIAKVAGYDALLAKMGPPSPAHRNDLEKARKAIAKELWDRYSARAITPASKKALRKMIARVIKTYTPTAAGSSLTAGLLP